MENNQLCCIKRNCLWMAFVALGLITTIYWEILSGFLANWIHPREENFHSLLALFLISILLWKSSDSLLKPVGQKPLINSCITGLVFLVTGLLALGMATVMEIAFLGQISFIFALWGLVILYFDRFPTGHGLLISFFLVQVIPWLIVTPLTISLKVMATKLSAGTAELLGWPVTYTQNLIQLNNVDFQVTAPCSGLHSVVGLTFIWFLASIVFKLPFLRIILWLPVIWIMAILLNALRIFLTIAWALWVETVTAFTVHTFLGYITFAIGVIILIQLSQKSGRHD